MPSVQESPVRPDLERGQHDGDADATTAALADLRAEVARQGRSIRGAQQAFSIFAVMALLIAVASLLAVAFKLQKESKPVAVVAAPAATARATTPSAPLPHNIDVTLAQFAVSPSASQAASGTVTFRVHNAGTIKHEFVVLDTPKLAADLPLSDGRADESGNVGETGDLPAGATKSVSLKLAPGHYALICNLPGHYLAGQHTDLTVR